MAQIPAEQPPAATVSAEAFFTAAETTEAADGFPDMESKFAVNVPTPPSGAVPTVPTSLGASAPDEQQIVDMVCQAAHYYGDINHPLVVDDVARRFQLSEQDAAQVVQRVRSGESAESTLLMTTWAEFSRKPIRLGLHALLKAGGGLWHEAVRHRVVRFYGSFHDENVFQYLSEPFEVISRLLAPASNPIDRENRPFDMGNRPLSELTADGVFYIRGVKYTLISEAAGGYFGGGATSCVWKAQRDPQAPLHDVRDPPPPHGNGDARAKVDRIPPLLNKAVIALRIAECNPGPQAEAQRKANRRWLEMHRRADYYVPEVVALLAATELPASGNDGPVSVAAVWAPQPPDAGGPLKRPRVLAQLPATNRYVLCAFECEPNGSVHKVMKEQPELLYHTMAPGMAVQMAGDESKVAGTLIRIGSDGEAEVQVRGRKRSLSRALLQPLVDFEVVPKAGGANRALLPQEERSVRSFFVQLMLQLQKLHRHGILHLSISVHSVVVDDGGRPHLAKFYHARPCQDPSLRPAQINGNQSDVHSLGDLLDCLLRGCAQPGAPARFAPPEGDGAELIAMMRGERGGPRPSVADCLRHKWARASDVLSDTRVPQVVREYGSYTGEPERDIVRRISPLLAPAVTTIDGNMPDGSVSDSGGACSFEDGIPPLKRLGKLGKFFLRGVEYRLSSKLGAGSFGAVWSARRQPCAAYTDAQGQRSFRQQPWHDVRDSQDRMSPYLNEPVIVVKLIPVHDNATYMSSSGERRDVLRCRSMRRELELHTRVQHYVVGAAALLAATPLPVSDNPRMHPLQPLEPDQVQTGPVEVDPKWVEPIEGLQIKSGPQDVGYVMMAMELCERATLAKWTGTLDATRRGMWTAIAKGLHDGQLPTDVGKQAIEGMAAADLAAATDRVRNTGRTGAALLPPAAHLAGGAVADKDAGEDRLAPTLLLAGNSPLFAGRPGMPESAVERQRYVHNRLCQGAMMQLLKQMETQHAHGVLHLDIKLENITIDRKWGVRLVDYGLSRPLHNGLAVRMTMGTAGYKAPEQGTTQPGPKWDMYSIGIVMYTLLCSCDPNPFADDAWQRYLVDTYVEGQVFRRGFNSTAPFPRSGVEAARTGADADANVDMMRQLFGQIRAQYRAYPWMMPCGTQDEAALDLLARLLRRDPRNRYSATMALQHRWFDTAPTPQEWNDLVQLAADALRRQVPGLSKLFGSSSGSLGSSGQGDGGK